MNGEFKETKLGDTNHGNMFQEKGDVLSSVSSCEASVSGQLALIAGETL